MEHADLLIEIQALLAPSAAEDGTPALARMEDTLTAGYARALALEAERWRLERQLGELASELGGEQAGDPEELARLARRMSDTSSELVRLRAALGALRTRAREARSPV